jgi:hypothetical protein
MKLITEISLGYLLLVLTVSAGLTWYFYFHKNQWSELSKKVRYSLYGIRFAVLTIIGILLLGLFIEHTNAREEKPILLTVIDNSSSSLNYRDSNEVKKILPTISSKIKALSANFDKKFYILDSELKNAEKIDFKGGKTNFSNAFEQIFTDYYNRNIGAIIFVSDGNYNEGQHPIYAASKIPFTPIFTVGIGDTLLKYDQILKDVIHNEIAFLKNKFPVQLNIEASKLKGKQAKVNLYHGSKLLASKQATYTKNEDFQQVIFEIEADKVGFQQYRAEVVPMSNEFTTKNNSIQFYVEVLDARNKILILSGAPHPDVSALKSVFEQDENVQVEYKTVEKWDRNTKNVDLIVWHEPGVAFSEELNTIIQNSKISILYFIGVNTNQGVIKKLNIGLETPSNNQFDEVQASFSDGFDQFELNKELISEIEKYPPLVAKYGSPKLGKQNQIVIQQKIASITKKEPLFFIGSNEQSKYGVFLGEGIWKWKMANYVKSKNHEVFSEFFAKVNQFLVQKKNTSNLRVSIPKRCVINEDILIKAEFYNEALELITKPKIAFQLIDAKGKKSELEFAAGNQQYLLQLGKLKAGLYKWKASTTFAGKKYQKSGSFVVEAIQLEKLDNRANHQLLNQLAANSNGKILYTLKNTQQLLKDLEKRDDITTVSYEQAEVSSILDFVFLLIFLLLLLGTEWFIKRWNGYY